MKALWYENDAPANAGAAYIFSRGTPEWEQAAVAFTVRNARSGSLTGLAITFDGAHAGDYLVTAPPVATVPPSGTTSYTVTFRPGAVGQRTATADQHDQPEGPYWARTKDNKMEAAGAALGASGVHRQFPTRF